MTSDHEPESNKDAAAAAQARFWGDVIVNEAESHVAALHRDRLLAERREAMERLTEARRSLAQARDHGDPDLLETAVADVATAGAEYRRIRDNVADELQEIIRARLVRMTAMAAHLGDAAEANSQWLSTLDFKGDGEGRAEDAGGVT
ncbi:hypothetical protein [Phytomonospora endophytica]|uniref:Uncharacterized protein n=1 Tax=Phytomonospora endophytica TaxID=714109 RepID=A0A841F6Q0_9ACTN|nr:hypothetical protein [Phytomonospora endophytica]MBB6032631.1 hypothetical protein [Phytomonospora endophytica]GIG66219.1 hypothetical protein Pen01_25140 [Phytomonospora endophytica]